MVSSVAVEEVADAPEELDELPDPEAIHKLQDHCSDYKYEVSILFQVGKEHKPWPRHVGLRCWFERSYCW
jgi:hypothetical protein